MGIYLWIAVGSALGGMGRHAVSEAILAQVDPQGIPWWTILVNITGSFAIGFVAAMTPPNPDLRLFLMTGVLGGYTTFSAFSLQTLDLAQRGEWAAAGLNVMLSVVLCLAAVYLGFKAGA
ncbi:MAG: fluoride efflux transporter CrcB [Proteobacteria bacterium]|nr:fluoride efflux transporter CrcB [Pseudomonadota bacterium]